MNSRASYHSRNTTPDEQRLYDHLLGCVALHSPEEMVARFQSLFIEGIGYPDREMLLVLDDILNAPEVDQYFRYILNRCCHILINRWQSHSQFQNAIPDLVTLLEQPPSRRINDYSRSRPVRRLRSVVQEFLDTEQYLTLKRLARVVEARQQQRKAMEEDAGSKPLGTLIDRYPYLYEHCLVSEDSDLEHQQHIRRIQAEAQHKFEVDLSHYVTYRVRLSRLNRQGVDKTQVSRLRPIDNPTLLSDQDLISSLKQFSVNGGDGQSYREVAHRFMVNGGQTRSYKSFKADLYDYITAGVEPGYGRRQFNKLLSQQLIEAYPDSDHKPLNDFLVVRTCSQLFNFLVVDSAHSGQHFVFVDLINNLGPLWTTGLLLRILLICRMVRPYVERRFSILFNHYEASSRDTVAWLVNVLENLNIALSLNFGTLDLSHVMSR
ncbi:hypothetical protein H6G13_25605 [Pseudanabaena sp. FACHB-2040]|nr:hypothetical protein [Pseudanabaena sp. FACHB-2040]